MGATAGLFIASLADAIGVVALALRTVISIVREVIQAFKSLGTFLGETAAKIYLFFTEDIPKAFKSVASAVKSFLQPIVDFLSSVVESIHNTLDRVIAFVGRLIAKIPSRFRPAFLDSIVDAGEAAHARIAERAARAVAPTTATLAREGTTAAAASPARAALAAVSLGAAAASAVLPARRRAASSRPDQRCRDRRHRGTRRGPFGRPAGAGARDRQCRRRNARTCHRACEPEPGRALICCCPGGRVAMTCLRDSVFLNQEPLQRLRYSGGDLLPGQCGTAFAEIRDTNRMHDSLPELQQVGPSLIVENYEPPTSLMQSEDASNQLIAFEPLAAPRKGVHSEDLLEVVVTHHELDGSLLKLALGQLGLDRKLSRKRHVELGYRWPQLPGHAEPHPECGGRPWIEAENLAYAAVSDSWVTEDVHEERIGAVRGIQLARVALESLRERSRLGVALAEAFTERWVVLDYAVGGVDEVPMVLVDRSEENDRIRHPQALIVREVRCFGIGECETTKVQPQRACFRAHRPQGTRTRGSRP